MADFPDLLPYAATRAAEQTRHRLPAALIREPLFHFLLIGAFLFGLGHVTGGARDNGRVITVTANQRRQIADVFAGARGHPPAGTEYTRAEQGWIATEVLYREAVALKLDSGDEMIRDRLVQKMRLLVENRVTIPKLSEEVLRAWFETRRAEFDTPARIDFFEVAVDGPDAETRAAAWIAAIEAGNDPPEARDRARVFANRAPAALDQVFGEGFAAMLQAMPPRVWRAVHSGTGWHLVRLDAVHPGKPADFTELKANLEVVFMEARRREAMARAIADLSAAYDIRREN